MAYEDIIELTFPEHWSDGVVDLAQPHELLALSPGDLKALASVFPKLRGQFDLQPSLPFSQDLEDQVAAALEKTDSPLFVKTSYGMLKQNPFAYAPVASFRDFETNLRWPDTRIEGYLHNRLSEDTLAYLVLSPWAPPERWQELRVFIEDGQVLGASQYHRDAVFPELRQNSEAIGQAVATFTSALTKVLHIPDVVADISIQADGKGAFSAQLIELNPFLPITDACLYSWTDKSRFDGGLRYRT